MAPGKFKRNGLDMLSSLAQKCATSRLDPARVTPYVYDPVRIRFLT